MTAIPMRSFAAIRRRSLISKMGTPRRDCWPTLFESVSEFIDDWMIPRQRPGQFFGIGERVIKADFHSEREVGVFELLPDAFRCAPREIRQAHDNRSRGL